MSTACFDIWMISANDSCSTNVTVPHSKDRTDPSKINVPKHEEKAPAPIDPSIDKWFYISGASA